MLEDKNNKYIKNYIFSVINTAMAMIFPLITFPYVSRILGANNLGVINFSTSYGYYFIHLANFGINSYALREVSKIRDNRELLDKISNEIYNINFLFSMASGIIYMLGVLLVPKLRVNWITFFIYSFVIYTNFLTLEWLLQSFDDYLFATIQSSVIRILSLVAVFIFVRRESDYNIYIFISTFSEMGARFSTLLYTKKKYVKLRLKWQFLNLSKYIKPLCTLFSYRFVNGVSSNLDKIMIGFLLTYFDVGIYSAGVKFALMFAPIVETVGIVLFPTINRMANSSKDEYAKVVKFNYDAILCMGIPMAIGLFLVSPKLTILFAGEEYRNSIEIARIMAVIIVLIPVGDLLGSKILLVHNKDKELLICSTIVAMSNIVLNCICIPIWKISGAAYATVFSYIIAIVARLYFAKKVIDFKLITKTLFRYILYCMPFVSIYIMFMNQIDSTVLGMIVFIITSMLIYLAEMLLFKDEIGVLLKKTIGMKRRSKK